MSQPAMLRLYLEGPALWATALPGWAWAAPALRGEAPTAGEAAPTARPSPALLAANERRRAPDGVLVALEVAAAAVAAAGRDAATLASVFTSAHGDLAIVDALCSTLAADPALLSPTRFHHSVHNAASGYWAMATGCHAPSSAIAGYEASFALGLLEAATQALTEQRPVLLAGFDTDARGALASVTRSRGLLGVALVLAPEPGARTVATLDWAVAPGTAALPALHSPAAQALGGNAMADALPLFEALARLEVACAGASESFDLPLGTAGLLHLRTIRAPAA
ncbi:beta-ketoacyl synthase chain length factor [Rubrivivax rivuli]|uniref:Beta-ketoacyl synthase-like N-terminal domain-containing protein n=1 Tax=Rubrivivax rivuli TaxID=1862385 RepID=A0A437RIG3_9BURK|nr:beta-ketoacyl synthase chain length factor [Rubrivivax rivuli]RVU46567.1 hypothetical protein EOE66_12200 [Rubrivivax rivuli]